jgi:hypothetical protein
VRYRKPEPPLGQEAVEALLGDPRELWGSLMRFGESARKFSSCEEQLRMKYPDKTVAWLHGELIAHADTIDELMCELDRRDIPRGDLIITKLWRDPPRMIV